MENMQRYLHPNKLKLISKGVDSVRSRVLNINEMYPNVTRDVFYDALQMEFLKYYNASNKEYADWESTSLPDEKDSNTIHSKVKELFTYYNSWEWKFGESPEFTNSLDHKFDFGLIELLLRVEKGVIQELTVYSDSLNTDFIDKLIIQLKSLGEKYTYDTKGLGQLFEDIKKDKEFSSDEYKKYIDSMKEEFAKQI
jgi:lipoate-protein ligase A